MGNLVGGTIIEGGLAIEDGLQRPVHPFGSVRRATVAGTLQAVIDVAEDGDVIYIEAGTYDENIVIATSGLTLVGMGARGRPWIDPSAGIGLHITSVDDIVIQNLGVAGAGAAAASMQVTASSESRFYGCKFEGAADTLVLLDGTGAGQCGNLMFFDCEWAWGLVGVEFDNSGWGYPTQMLFRRCWFHEVTTAHMRDNAAGGGVVDLWVEDCRFCNSEDGTEPTDYIVIDRVGDSGFFTGNYFAMAANVAVKCTIAAGIIWGPNGTEAGWSTARPA